MTFYGMLHNLAKSFPVGLRFRPVGLRFRLVGLSFRPLGLRFRPVGLRSSVFVFGSSFLGLCFWVFVLDTFDGVLLPDFKP